MMKNGLLVRWDITKKCNLKCKHCINGNKYLNTQEASFEEKKQIIDNLATGGVSRIHLLGGEATTVDKIEELVEYACSKGIRVSLNTNSIVMAENESLCNTFAKCDVDVSFSIDGTTAELHEQIRGRGTYDAIIKASQKYYELTKNKRVVRAFYYTLTPDNKHDDFNSLFSLAANLGINNIVVGVMIPLGHGKENYHGKTLDGDELLDIAEKCYK
ncbi:MAG: radical SAM protein [Lachnospiraceae bacterium]|jgi:MoaA/NifB/PqqE/SkfB family radical SAM enzyme|nr:radical SAM protein [Lachnospiraceae bacterium]